MKGYIKPSLAFAALVLFAANSFAESRTINPQDTNAYKASARLKLRVVIPEVLRFQISDEAARGNVLALPGKATTPSASINSRQTIITGDNETAGQITYTSASL